MIKVLSHRAVYRKYSALPLTERPNSGYGDSYPATSFVRRATATQVRYGFRALDGSGGWYHSYEKHRSIREDISSFSKWSSGDIDTWESYLDVFSPDQGATYYRFRRVDYRNPINGSLSSETSYIPGLASDKSYTKLNAPSNEKVFYDENGNSTIIGSIWNFGSQTERDRLTNPDWYYYFPDHSTANISITRPIDKDETVSFSSTELTQSIRTIDVYATFHLSGGGIDESSEIKFKRVTTDEKTVSSPYEDSEWVSIAASRLSSYGPEIQSDIVGSTFVTGTESAPVLNLVATKYKIKATIPAFERNGIYYLVWIIEDGNGVKRTHSEWIYPDEGQTEIISKEHDFIPNKSGTEWKVVSAKAIFYNGRSDVITQETTRDSRPLTYRDVFRNYSILEKPAYLINRIRWNLYASKEWKSEEIFDNGNGWRLGQSTRRESNEVFANSSGWATRASGVISDSDEDFPDADGWDLAFPESTRSDERFNNSTGWTLFSS